MLSDQKNRPDMPTTVRCSRGHVLETLAAGQSVARKGDPKASTRSVRCAQCDKTFKISVVTRG